VSCFYFPGTVLNYRFCDRVSGFGNWEEFFLGSLDYTDLYWYTLFFLWLATFLGLMSYFPIVEILSCSSFVVIGTVWYIFLFSSLSFRVSLASWPSLDYTEVYWL
jgi:hypothetical protein